uniref:Uncharacterized protein n=1 Tax=Anopheles coluzzii TaxID=1518534 RepID=A0A8W7PZE1_ANOCL
MMAETVVTVETPNRTAASPAATPAPGQAQAKPESNLNWLKFNTQYFITIPGILKIVQVPGFVLISIFASGQAIVASVWRVPKHSTELPDATAAHLAGVSGRSFGWNACSVM